MTASPDDIVPRRASVTTGQSELSTIWPTRSTRKSVVHVVGRICPSTISFEPAVPRTGATSSRSENERSESTPHDPSSRWR